jgi:nitrogen fixation protein NifU and related proteins
MTITVNTPRASELYQQLVLQHFRQPIGYGPLAGATHESHGYSPSCGDKISIQASCRQDGALSALQFEAQCCALCKASASLMMGHLKTVPQPQMLAHVETFLQSMTAGATTSAAAPGVAPVQAEGIHRLSDDLKIFDQVREFPARIACVLLPWTTLKKILIDPMGTKLTVSHKG